jgi:hypothetical protein
MHPLTKLASKLYPKWWRDRYGDEFAALLEDARPGLGGAFDIAKGALAMHASATTPKILLACALIGLVSVVTFALRRGPHFQSTSVVSMAAPPGTTSRQMIDSISAASLDIFSRRSLTQMIRDLKLYGPELRTMVQEDVLERMRREIRLTPVPGSGPGKGAAAFTVSFTYREPDQARKVVQAITAKFIDQNIQARSQSASVLTLELLDSASTPRNIDLPLWQMSAIGIAAGLLLGGSLAFALRLARRIQANRSPTAA